MITKTLRARSTAVMFSALFFSIFLKANLGHAQVGSFPAFDAQKVEAQFEKQIFANTLKIKSNQVLASLWLPVVDDYVLKASNFQPVALSTAAITRILCEPVPTLRVDFFFRFANCGRADGIVVFNSQEEELLKAAFAVWSTPARTDLFARWMLTDILAYALERNGASEVQIQQGLFVFRDELLDSYFSARLLGSTTFPLGAKSLSIPDAVLVQSGRVAPEESNFTELILGSFRPYGGIVVDRSPFAARIGTHSFLTQILYMNFAVQYGSRLSTETFSRDLLKTIFQEFQGIRWLAWAELFAFPEDRSPRNVEFWNQLLPIRSSNPDLVSRYLDLDQRPSARPLTKSEAGYRLIEQRNTGSVVVRFEGKLGAIPSDRESDQFVGFTGVEVKAGVQKLATATGAGRPAEVGFEIDLLSSQERVLTVQLVTEKSGKEQVYSTDLRLVPGRNRFPGLTVSSFVRTSRGEPVGEGLDSSARVISYRFFFKRSANQPRSFASLPVAFEIDTQSLRRVDYK